MFGSIECEVNERNVILNLCFKFIFYSYRNHICVPIHRLCEIFNSKTCIFHAQKIQTNASNSAKKKKSVNLSDQSRADAIDITNQILLPV